jgi:hypothetical protein
MVSEVEGGTRRETSGSKIRYWRKERRRLDQRSVRRKSTVIRVIEGPFSLNMARVTKVSESLGPISRAFSWC